MAHQGVVVCSASLAATGGPCGGGDPNLALWWSIFNGLQPRSDYNSSWDELAFTTLKPSPPGISELLIQ